MSRNQVPVEATSQVISGIIRELAQQEVDFPPDTLTISQFAHELGVISDLQVGEVLVHNDNLTLAWDAISIDADHLNHVHVLYSASWNHCRRDNRRLHIAHTRSHQ